MDKAILFFLILRWVASVQIIAIQTILKFIFLLIFAHMIRKYVLYNMPKGWGCDKHVPWGMGTTQNMAEGKYTIPTRSWSLPPGDSID